MRWRRRSVVAALTVALAATVVGIAWTAGRPARREPVSTAEARAAASRACAEAAGFERLVGRNASIDDVRASLRRAEAQADLAARGDAAWYALAGGIKALRLSLDANDARAARTGIDVVRTECRRLGE